MARIKPAKGQLGLFDNAREKPDPGNLENRIILNNDPAFGLLDKDVKEKMIGLFMREGRPKNDVNFRLIKGAYSGYRQMEYKGLFGVPVEIYHRLNTADIPSFCFGIDNSKARDPELGGYPFGKLIAHLVASGYRQIGERKYAKNAVRAMKHRKLGFTGFGAKPKIEERMDSLEDGVKIQFLRSFHKPRYFSQEDHGVMAADYNDSVFQSHCRDGKPLYSNDAREMYVEEFISLLYEKQKKGDDFDMHNFEGFIVPSKTTPEKKQYYVEKTVPFARKAREPTYSCTCPYYIIQKKECSHIKSVR